MKTLVRIILALILMTQVAYAEDKASMQDRGEFYPLLTIVVEKDYTESWPMVICEDRHGNLWAFYDDDDTWAIGDIANLLMWNMGGSIENDEIIEVYWEGYTDNLKMFFQTNGWE